MDKFVCVRVVAANALDLTRFQFDYDLTFAIQFSHGDGTVYGRYGSRSDAKDADREISMEGFAAAMDAALTLHEGYPDNKALLAGKQPRPVKVQRPEEYPALARYKPKLDYQGNVVQSCMHCHQIRDAQREPLRRAGEPMPDDVLYPYPLPDAVGMSLDAKTAATVASVAPGTPAARAGVRAGDVIEALDGQPILSMADVQWALHHAGATARLPLRVQRGGSGADLTLNLPAGWRGKTDIGWRVSTWALRRDHFGGMYPIDMTDAQRRAARLPPDTMALRLEHVGQYGEHAVAKRAGFQKGDVIVSFDGQTKRMTETELHAHVNRQRKSGDRVPVKIIRGDKRMELTLPLP